MAKKRMSHEDRAILVGLMERYSGSDLTAELKALSRRRPAGRPTTTPKVNFIGVYGFVEAHRKLVSATGKRLGVRGACKKLKRLLDDYTVNFRTSQDRLTKMYYEARKLAASDVGLSESMKAAAGRYQQSIDSKILPLLFFQEKDGSLRSVIIDRSGRGGAPVEKSRPKNLN